LFPTSWVVIVLVGRIAWEEHGPGDEVLEEDEEDEDAVPEEEHVLDGDASPPEEVDEAGVR